MAKVTKLLRSGACIQTLFSKSMLIRFICSTMCLAYGSHKHQRFLIKLYLMLHSYYLETFFFRFSLDLTNALRIKPEMLQNVECSRVIHAPDFSLWALTSPTTYFSVSLDKDTMNVNIGFHVYRIIAQ